MQQGITPNGKCINKNYIKKVCDIDQKEVQ